MIGLVWKVICKECAKKHYLIHRYESSNERVLGGQDGHPCSYCRKDKGGAQIQVLARIRN